MAGLRRRLPSLRSERSPNAHDDKCWTFAEGLQTSVLSAGRHLMQRLFVVDVLVNATGAVLILFFLLILRLSPSQSNIPPMFPDRPVMWIDVAVDIGGDIERLALWLQQEGRNGKDAVFRPAARGSPLKLGVSVPTPFGPWGSTRQGETLRVVVPCPEPDSRWRLSLKYPATGDEIIKKTKATVNVTLSSKNKQDLSSTAMTRDNQTGTLTQAVSLIPGEIPVLRWTNTSEIRCD